MKASSWYANGSYIEVLGHKLFVVDQGKSKDTLLILHGYPTSSYDYYKVLDDLSANYRVIIHDHLGFGFSDKPQNCHELVWSYVTNLVLKHRT